MKKLTVNKLALENLIKNIQDSKDTELLIVTKNQTIEDISTLINMGFRVFGENRVQEAKKKFLKNILGDNLNLHLIGPLQTNKVKLALKIFDVIQSVDRINLIDEISKYLKNELPVKTKNFFIQVNIGNEPQKSGINKQHVKEIYQYSIKKGLKISGLMCIPPNDSNSKFYFQEMIELKNNIDNKLKLSMGMSNDYLEAVKCKSNMIRVGSLIFD